MTALHRTRSSPESAQHWREVHLRGDSSPPINLPDRRARRSIGTAICIRERGRKEQVIYE